MAVPAHDERDFDFAKKYNLPITQSIISIQNLQKEKKDWEMYDFQTLTSLPETATRKGELINS